MDRVEGTSLILSGPLRQAQGRLCGTVRATPRELICFSASAIQSGRSKRTNLNKTGCSIADFSSSPHLTTDNSGNVRPRKQFDLMVGAEGFEPPTLCSQSRCATRLRYAPILGLYRNQGLSGLPGEPLQEPKDEEDRG